MAKRSSELEGFLKSLVLLGFALIAAFLILFQYSSDTPDVTIETEDVRKVRRKMLRQATKPVGDRIAAPLAQTQEPVHRPVEAIAESREADMASADPAVSDGAMQAAIAAIDDGDVERAMALLEEVLKKDPNDEQALVEMAMIHLLDLKQTDRAIRYLERVLKVNPANRIVISELVSLYDEEDLIEDGLSYLMDMQQKTPETPEVNYGIGQMLAMQGRNSEAIPYLERAAGGDDVRVMRDLAEAYSRNGDSEKAISSYEKAVERQAQDVLKRSQTGMPATFAEERLNYMRLDLARELIRSGDLDRAQSIIDEVENQLPGDEGVLALRDQIKRKRSG